MDLSPLTSLIQNITVYKQLKDKLLGPHSNGIKLVVADAIRPMLIAALHRELDVPVLLVAAQPESARRLYDELQVWCQDSTYLYLLSETDLLLHESAYNGTTDVERLKTLSALMFFRGRTVDQRPPLIVSSASAAADKTISKDEFRTSCYLLKVGMEVDPRKLAIKWQDMGYEFGNVVEIPGTVSRRGGIIDVFSPDSDFPARIELAGNSIESIRLFDPKTQRSLRLITAVNVVPARERHQQVNGDTIVDYLDEKALLITDDVDELKIAIDNLYSEAEEISQEKAEPGKKPDLPVIPWPAFEKRYIPCRNV